MIGNISILILSFIFISIIILYLVKKGPDLDIIDLYIIFVLLHFGVTAFIRGLYFGKDYIYDFRNANPITISLVFAQVLIILFIIRVISLYFPEKIANYLKIRYLIKQWCNINKYILFIIYAGLVIFPLISYYKFGVKTYILPEDFVKIGKTLPYWFTSIRTVYINIAFCIFISLLANIVKHEKYQQVLWIILTVIFVPIVTIYGRRFLLNMIIVAIIFWFVYKKESMFRLKYIVVGLLSLGIFFMASNIYQSYRYPLLFTVGQIQPKKLENPFSAAFNFNSTIHNIKERAGTWEFNFFVFDHQINKSEMTTNGKITWEGFKSSIPRVFWPGKHFSLIDDMLSEFYQVNRKQVDFGKNLFGIGQLDFGYYSLILVPAIILMIIVLMAGLVSITLKSPTFLVLFTGNIINFLINIEENGNEIFFMLRNIFILFVLYGCYIAARKIYMTFWNYKMGNSPN